MTILRKFATNYWQNGFIYFKCCRNINLAINKHTLKPLNTVHDLYFRLSNSVNVSEYTASQVFRARKLIRFLMNNFSNMESRFHQGLRFAEVTYYPENYICSVTGIVMNDVGKSILRILDINDLCIYNR